MCPMPPLNAIGITVSNMAESIRFYRALGLEVPDTPDEGHVEAAMPDGARLMLDSEEVVLSFLPEWKRVDGNQVALAFECESPGQVDEIYSRVTEAGFEGEKAPWDAFWGQRYAVLGDPDGVVINLYAALPAQ
jgi:catechol 2,3-dioxygenase-like lactoylglutathione lyase family enzyme